MGYYSSISWYIQLSTDCKTNAVDYTTYFWHTEGINSPKQIHQPVINYKPTGNMNPLKMLSKREKKAHPEILRETAKLQHPSSHVTTACGDKKGKQSTTI